MRAAYVRPAAAAPTMSRCATPLRRPAVGTTAAKIHVCTWLRVLGCFLSLVGWHLALLTRCKQRAMPRTNRAPLGLAPQRVRVCACVCVRVCAMSYMSCWPMPLVGDPQQECQCNPTCSQYSNCCSDYWQQCNREELVPNEQIGAGTMFA